jgi:hypothetical protein
LTDEFLFIEGFPAEISTRYDRYQIFSGERYFGHDRYWVPSCIWPENMWMHLHWSIWQCVEISAMSDARYLRQFMNDFQLKRRISCLLFGGGTVQ